MTSIPLRLAFITLLGLLSALAGWHMPPAAQADQTRIGAPHPRVASAVTAPRFRDENAAAVVVAELKANAETQTPVARRHAVPAARPTPPPHVKARGLFARAREQSPQVAELDPSLPGHSVSGSGLTVYLERSYLPTSGAGVEMDVGILPDGQEGPAAWGNDDFSRFGRGFTEEELAFRAKWGWAAHDAALRLAFATANAAARPASP